MLKIFSAHHPRDRGNAGGKYHLVTDEEIHVQARRYNRRKGQALCASPSKTFWGLYDAGVGADTLKTSPRAFCTACLSFRELLSPEQAQIAEPPPPPPSDLADALNGAPPLTRERVEEMAKGEGVLAHLARATLRKWDEEG